MWRNECGNLEKEFGLELLPQVNELWGVNPKLLEPLKVLEKPNLNLEVEIKQLKGGE